MYKVYSATFNGILSCTYCIVRQNACFLRPMLLGPAACFLYTTVKLRLACGGACVWTTSCTWSWCLPPSCSYLRVINRLLHLNWRNRVQLLVALVDNGHFRLVRALELCQQVERSLTVARSTSQTKPLLH